MTDFIVDSAGRTQRHYPYIDSAIEKLRAQRAAGANAGGVRGTPSATTVIDRSRPGIVKRVLGSKVAKGGALLAAAGAAANQFQPGATEKFAKRFGVDGPDGVVAKIRDPMNPISTTDYLKLTALNAGGFLTDVADNASFGIIGNLLYKDKRGRGAVAGTGGDGTGAGTPGSVDLGKVAPVAQAKQAVPTSNPAQPPRSIVRNARGGAAPEELPQPQNEAPNVPNVGLATDVDTLPAFLQQIQGAQQTVANNKTASANRRGIVSNVRNTQDIEKGNIDNQESQLKLQQSQQLQSVLDQVTALDETKDPGGNQRRQLLDQAAVLQGKNPGDRFDFKTVQGVDPSTMESIQQLVRVDPRTGEYQFLGGAQAPAAGQGNEKPPVEGAQKAPDGKWYVKQGDKFFRVDQ
jgi:hypothetical protein